VLEEDHLGGGELGGEQGVGGDGEGGRAGGQGKTTCGTEAQGDGVEEGLGGGGGGGVYRVQAASQSEDDKALKINIFHCLLYLKLSNFYGTFLGYPS